ncbi:hypothetical protein CRI93_14865 [Longimonas halophila]|uniref:Uncharacterized protein n=1 Tax=Longimonas halophila TaxID=1469170 RepID=A0A2H3NHM2_9BACT|nr:hypothetical protein [Longimonas halophila]PEN04620.1 hypothetical protein CRI93_14865 [Longimonas halophila]
MTNRLSRIGARMQGGPPDKFDLDPATPILFAVNSEEFILTCAAHLDETDKERVEFAVIIEDEPERLSWWERVKARAIALITDLLHHSPAVR